MGLRQTIESILATYKENETVNIKMQNGIDDLTFVFKKSQTEKISLSCSLMSFPTHVWYCDDENEAPEEVGSQMSSKILFSDNELPHRAPKRQLGRSNPRVGHNAVQVFKHSNTNKTSSKPTRKLN